MKGLQVAEHLCLILAGGCTVSRSIILFASVDKECDGSVSAERTATEGILKPQSSRPVLDANDFILDIVRRETRAQIDLNDV